MLVSLPLANSRRCRVLILARALLVACVCLAAKCSSAQPMQQPSLDGYVTATPSARLFEIQGKRFKISATTEYGYLGKALIQIGEGTLHDSLQTGAYVHVLGLPDQRTQVLEARAVYLRNDLDHKLSGVGVIDKVISPGPDPTFRADGYLLHLTSASDLTFAATSTASPTSAPTPGSGTRVNAIIQEF